MVASRISRRAESEVSIWVRLVAKDLRLPGSTIEPNEDAEQAALSVRSMPLDQWLSRHPELEPDAIKIDVERHELEVLEGAAGLLARTRPALMVECHGAAWDELGVARSRFTELLGDAGYRDLRFADGGPADFIGLHTTAHLWAVG